MSDFDPALLRRVRQALLKCDEFQSPRLLNAVMGTTTLSPWQNGLPNADAVGERVDFTIHYLSDKYHLNGENALVLLLQVLSDRYTEQDERHKMLSDLADKLWNVGRISISREERMNQKAHIRQKIIDSPLSGAKLLSEYMDEFPSEGKKRAELDLKIADLKRIEHDIEIFGPNENQKAERNRIILYLLEFCAKMK